MQAKLPEPEFHRFEIACIRALHHSGIREAGIVAMKIKSDSSLFWTSVATFERLEHAQALQECLEKAGFEARTQDERKLQRYWFFSPQHCGVHVRVPTESLELAREFLATESAAVRIMEEAIRCPSCHSSRVQYPQMTRKFILPTVVAHLLVLLRVMGRECYCEDCHYTWAEPSGARGGDFRIPQARAKSSGNLQLK